MNKIILITGASSGFGRLTANALADAGHTVYASMRETRGRNAPQVADVEKYAKDHGVDLNAIELDVGSQESVDAGVAAIIEKHGHLDVVMHNAGHMAFGPAEAFTPEQLGGTVRCERPQHPTGQQGRLAAIAQAGAGPSGMGFEQQFRWWHAALSVALLRREGSNGRDGRAICP